MSSVVNYLGREARGMLFVCFVFVALVVVPNLGSIEGRLLPAAKPMDLIVTLPTKLNPKFVDAPDSGAAVFDQSGQFTAVWVGVQRTRKHCKPRYLEWFSGSRKAHNSPVKWSWGPPVSRDENYFTAGPWLFGVKADNFKSTYGDVLHRCYWFGVFRSPWLTRSRLWN